MRNVLCTRGMLYMLKVIVCFENKTFSESSYLKIILFGFMIAQGGVWTKRGAWPTQWPTLWPTGGQIFKNLNKTSVRVEWVNWLKITSLIGSLVSLIGRVDHGQDPRPWPTPRFVHTPRENHIRVNTRIILVCTCCAACSFPLPLVNSRSP